MVTVKRTPKNKSNGTRTASAVPVVKASTRNLNVQDAIGSYAYSLYEQRGRQHGHDLDDWLRAEGEVLTTLTPNLEKNWERNWEW
jgi:hypothetical protein